jgi:hypothetical protein
MQEVPMAVSTVPRRSSQLPLFARPRCNPHCTNLASDVQQKIVRLLAEITAPASRKRGNRLVASELERRWNDALQQVQQLEARVEQAMRVQQVSPATKEEFEALAGDLEAVWSHPDTDARLKKRIVLPHFRI